MISLLEYYAPYYTLKIPDNSPFYPCGFQIDKHDEEILQYKI
jgi:hypothetical protein